MNTLTVQKRSMESKVKRLRREGYVTGNLFGKGFTGSIPLQIEEKEAKRIQKECLKGSQLSLTLDGKKYDVLLKELNYNPAAKQILEMDFQALVKGEAVNSTAKILYHNIDKISEGILEQQISEISYKAKPKDLIDHIDIDCSTMRLGTTIKVADLDIAQNKNIEISTHMDAVVAVVIASKNRTSDSDKEEESEPELIF